MTNEFTATAKRSARGITYTVYHKGVEIGSRTTKGSYRFAVVAFRRYAYELVTTQQNVAYHDKSHAEYSRAAEGQYSPGQIKVSGLAGCEAHRTSGDWAKWADSAKQQAESTRAKLAELEALDQNSGPFAAPRVIAFSNKPGSNRSGVPGQVFANHIDIELPQP